MEKKVDVTNNKKEYLFVLDHSTNTCTKIDISKSNRMLSSEEVLIENGFDLDVCDWMYSEKDIDEIVYLPINL